MSDTADPLVLDLVHAFRKATREAIQADPTATDYELAQRLSQRLGYAEPVWIDMLQLMRETMAREQ